MKFRWIIISLLVMPSFVVLFPGSGFAQTLWTENGVPVSATAGEQMESSMTFDGSGGAIIAWMDNRNGNWDIYAQRLDAAGNPLWALNGVPVCTAAGIQGGPRMASDGSGGAIIIWLDIRGGDWDIYAQRMDANGNPMWAADGVSLGAATTADFQPQIIPDGWGGAIIAWTEDGGEITWSDIYAQRLDTNGNALWSPGGEPVCAAVGDQVGPQLVSDGSGGAVITWMDWRNPTWDIYAQRMAANGNTMWIADGVVVCDAANDQEDMVIVSDGAGGAIIAWEDWRNGVSKKVYAQKIIFIGNGVWTANGVDVCGAPGEKDDPVMASDGSGGAIIAWEDERNGIEDIYAQRMDGNGNLVWTADGIPVAHGADTQEDPVIIGDGSGGAFIAWELQIAGVDDIYAQRVSHGGVLYWPADGIGVPVCVGNYETDDQVLALVNTGMAVVSWTDNRGADQDIYAQKIAPENNNGLGRAAAVPTLSQWGIILFSMGLLISAAFALKRRRLG